MPIPGLELTEAQQDLLPVLPARQACEGRFLPGYFSYVGALVVGLDRRVQVLEAWDRLLDKFLHRCEWCGGELIGGVVDGLLGGPGVGFVGHGVGAVDDHLSAGACEDF